MVGSDALPSRQMDFEKTRETLILKIRDCEDDASWSNFVTLYTPLIYRFCASRGVPESDIADVTQETLQSVSRAIRNFEYDPEKARFRTWLFRVTWSKIANYFRRKRHQPQGTGRTTVQRFLEEQPSPDSEKDWDRDYRQHVFHWAREKVRPEFQESTWKAFEAVAVERKSGNEAARELDMTVGAVYTAKSRVIARLRETVQALTGEMDVPGEIA